MGTVASPDTVKWLLVDRGLSFVASTSHGYLPAYATETDRMCAVAAVACVAYDHRTSFPASAAPPADLVR